MPDYKLKMTETGIEDQNTNFWKTFIGITHAQFFVADVNACDGVMCDGGYICSTTQLPFASCVEGKSLFYHIMVFNRFVVILFVGNF